MLLGSDGYTLVSGSWDKKIMVWDFRKHPRCIKTLLGHSDWVRILDKQLENRVQLIISGSWDKTIRQWDFKSGNCVRILEGNQDYIVYFLTLSNCHLLSASSDKTIRKWDLTTGDCSLVIYGHTDWVDCLLALPSCDASCGSQIVSGFSDNTIKMCKQFY